MVFSENSLKKNLLRSSFFNFFKNLFHFKKAQSSHILSPEALIECVRKVFAYSLILKRKKIFATILNPSNPPLFKAQKHVFSRITHIGSISKNLLFSAPMTKIFFSDLVIILQNNFYCLLHATYWSYKTYPQTIFRNSKNSFLNFEKCAFWNPTL